MGRIRRYARLYKAFVRYTFAREASFRGDFLSYVFVNLLWAGFSIFIVGIFYTQTDAIAGWTLGEAIALLATWQLVNGILTFFVRRNFSKLPDDIKDGHLDLVLTKPINSQFLVSFKHIDTPKIFNVLFAIALLVFGLIYADATVTWQGAIVYVLLIGAGVAISYAMWFSLLTLSFRYLGMSNLEMLFDSIYRFARFPADAYMVAGKVILFTIVPLGIVTQLPAEALARGLAWQWVIYALGIAVVFMAISVKLWNHQIKKYASASS